MHQHDLHAVSYTHLAKAGYRNARRAACGEPAVGYSVDLVGAYGAEAVQGIHAVAGAQHADAGELSGCI